MSKQNVIVVGGGPTGLITALGLARSGIDVTVLEAERTINDSPRAMVYHWAVLDGLERLGILADVEHTGFINPDLYFIVHTTGERIRMDLGSLKGYAAHPYNVHLGQEKLAEIALQHLSRHAGTRVHWNTRVTQLTQDSTGVTLHADTPEGPQQFRAAWVVGADGGRSTVRQLLGLNLEGMTWDERFVATNIRYDFSAHDFARANMVMGYPYSAVIAKIDNTGLWRCTYSEDASLSEAGIRERMQRYFEDTLPGSKDYELVQYSPYRMHQRAVERMRVGRVVLAGDAAHITNPTGGLGLTCGLFDAYVLYEALAAVAHGQLSDEILDRYAEQRLHAFTAFASPGATSNKQQVFDPHTADEVEQMAAGLRHVSKDPALQRELLMQAKRCETPSLLPSR